MCVNEFNKKQQHIQVAKNRKEVKTNTFLALKITSHPLVSLGL